MLLLPYLGGVFLLPGCCDPFNEKALRASRGAFFQLPIVSRTWTHLEALRNKFHLKILAGHPESNEQSKPTSRLSQGLADSLANFPLCLVLGGEGSGLSAKTRQISLQLFVVDRFTKDLPNLIAVIRLQEGNRSWDLMSGASTSGGIRTAFSYCVQQIRNYDYHHYLCLLELPPNMRKAAFALRAFNVETARAMDIASDPKTGLMCPPLVARSYRQDIGQQIN